MNASSMFVTLLFAVLDFRSGSLKYSRAGHLPPVVMEENGRWLDLPVDEGQPLGLFPDVKIDQQECNLPAGGLALIFSAG